MTNFEHYKEDILEITNRGYNVAVVNDKPIACADMQYCTGCQLTQDAKWRCHLNRMKWLYEEHVEKPKLTKKERQFCEFVETGWICRDANGCLYRYLNIPIKRSVMWGNNDQWKNSKFQCLCIDDLFHNCNFSFITWDDEEPWSIEDLLKLEVEE